MFLDLYTLLSDDKITDYLQMDSIISGFQQGTENFSQEITDMIKTQMGVWIDDMNQGTSKGTEYIGKALKYRGNFRNLNLEDG